MKRLIPIFAFVTVLSLLATSPSQAQIKTPTPQCMTIESGQVCYYSNTEETPTETQTETATPTNTFTPTPTETGTPIPTPTNTPPQVTRIPLQTSIEFYRNPAFPALSCITSTTYWFPGTALTASTHRFYGDLLQGAKIIHAFWGVAWTPNSTSANTGVRLVKFDNGPVNIEEIYKIEKIGTTPLSDGAYITDALQAIIDAGQFKQLGFQVRGNGTSNTCVVYASWIEIVWK